jgi:hypothetical protein
MLNYLGQGRTMNGMYYADELTHLRQEILRKRKGKLIQSVLLLHVNKPAHTSKVAMVLQLTAALKFFTIRHILRAPSFSCFRN